MHLSFRKEKINKTYRNIAGISRGIYPSTFNTILNSDFLVTFGIYFPKKRVGLARFELATSSLSGMRSNQAEL